MLTTKTICALLLGVGIGAGGAVVVQKSNAPKREVGNPAKASGKPGGLTTSRARVGRPENRASPACPIMPRILDCPSPAPSLGPGIWETPSVSPLPPSNPGDTAARPPLWPGGGGVVTAPPPIFPPAPGIPEPAQWAMTIAGLGLVGLSLRRRPRSRKDS